MKAFVSEARRWGLFLDSAVKERVSGGEGRHQATAAAELSAFTYKYKAKTTTTGEDGSW